MKQNIPAHIAIIPDGNRRWAKEKGFKASYGYKKGGNYEHTRNLFLEAKNLGVKYVSFWAFSTENWERPKEERETIFSMLLDSIPKLKKDCFENELRFIHLGRKDRVPKRLVFELSKLEEETKHFHDFNIVLCLDYGGRDEIVRAVNKIIKSGLGEVNEEKFSEFLDSSGIPDVDLIIRTAGEQRTSGFMPFQSVYSEFYFSNVYFPDFDEKELKKAIEDFGKRKRNFGG